MNSRYNILLLGLLACIGFCLTSCSDEESLIDPYGRKKRGDHYLSFHLNTDPSGLSLTRSVEYSQGTKEERSVGSVYLLIYEAAGLSGNLLYTIPIAAQTDGENDFHGGDVVSGDKTHFISKPVSLERQDYQIVVLVNPSVSLLSSKAKSQEDEGAGCNNLKDMTDALTQAAPEHFYNATGKSNFFMSNAGGVIYISEDNLQKKGDEAISKPVSIPVERLLAKVSVHKGFTGDDVSLGGTIGAVTWGIDLTNKQTYLIRQGDLLIDGQPESGFHANRMDVYAKDPNFNMNSEFIANETKKKEHFNIIDPLKNDDFLAWNTTNQTEHYRYILENTMSKEDQNNDKADPKSYTTHIVLKVIITKPKGLDATSYYSYYDETEANANNRWKVFTHEQAVEWFNNSYPIDMAALEPVLIKAQEMENSPFNFKKDEDKAPDKYVTTSFKLTYHKDGLNIYRIPIMHFGVDDRIKSVEDYGYYGIVRNNIYNITIKSIKGPGIDSSNEGYLSAEINIKPWNYRRWEEDIKPSL